MKNRRSIVFWLAVIVAGLSVQMTALGLNPSYPTSQSSKLKIAGLPRFTLSTSGTCTFSSVTETNGTFDLSSTGGYDYTGEYRLVNKGKKMAFSPDAGDAAEFESMLTTYLTAAAGGYGVSGISTDVRHIKITKAKMIPATTGDPNKTTITVLGKIHATYRGHLKTKSFTLRTTVTID